MGIKPPPSWDISIAFPRTPEVLDLGAPEELRLGTVPGPEDQDGIDIEE